MRSVGKEIVKEIGRKILSGHLNLTQISFPIRCMQANTALHNTLKGSLMSPLYLNKAAATSDPLERMKLVIVCSISSYIHTSTFLKPLNPILGETLHARLEDGGEMWAEQTSHHPPVSHFYIEGPNKNYVCHGYYNYTAKAGLNSVTITNVGKKVFQFPDGQIITHNLPNELFAGTFFGTMRHESLGVLVFTDSLNRYKAKVEFAFNKNLPSDYISGEITDIYGNKISEISGTYCGHIEIDGKRYWDARHIRPFRIDYDIILPSDSEIREDIVTLRRGLVDEAQAAKEALEVLQRHDRKLRGSKH
mmetsp:Transcript_25987/g.25578  ORF Transcript_25987/g.25578 Transcript_25987/m.25578 type:complete len:305 (-) Transcript_25987:40-954(-)